jgi:hypothetical protein
MFLLLKPMLRYHEYWNELEYQEISGEGLKQLEDFSDSPSELAVDDAFRAVQEMRTATLDFGLLCDIKDQIVEAKEAVDYWMKEVEQASEASSEGFE